VMFSSLLGPERFPVSRRYEHQADTDLAVAASRTPVTTP
jgi:hypothetical protein